MNLLNLLQTARRDHALRNSSDDRAARRRRANRSRPALDALEGRLVLSTVPAAPFVGPMPAPHVLNAASSSPQSGVAFGMSWASSVDSGGNTIVVIQDVQGTDSINVYRTKAGVFFSDANTGSTVAGPTVPQNNTANVYAFADSGDQPIQFTTGIYWTHSVQPRTSTGSVSTPTGSVGLVYSYNAINNTGVLTVNDIDGSGTITYTRTAVDPADGPPVNSPSADPINSYDFLYSNDYNGGVNVFRSGMANAAITVVVQNSPGVGNSPVYSIVDADAPQQGSAFGLAWTATYNPSSGTYDVSIQDATGSDTIDVSRTKQGLFFKDVQTGRVIAGPKLASGAYATITAHVGSGQMSLAFTSGIYVTWKVVNN